MSHREMNGAGQRHRDRANDPTWYTSAANLATLARYCVAVLDFDRDDLVRLIEAPWDWRAEFAAALVWQLEQARPTKARL